MHFVAVPTLFTVKIFSSRSPILHRLVTLDWLGKTTETWLAGRLAVGQK
jgi:hypothetical protein